MKTAIILSLMFIGIAAEYFIVINAAFSSGLV